MSAPPDRAIPYGRLLALLLAVTLTGAAAGCGSTVQEDSQLTVYASVPLSGADADSGKAIAAGAKSALADADGEAGGAPVALELLDDVDGAGWTQPSVAANARDATQDSTSIAYIGELESDATRISAPITNEAGLLQVTPGAVSRGLLAEPGGNDVPGEIQTTGDRTLGAIAPDGGIPTLIPTSAPPERQLDYLLGYESMAVILDSIDRAEDPLSRADVVDAFLATTDRTGKTGTYTIGPDGAAAYAD